MRYIMSFLYFLVVIFIFLGGILLVFTLQAKTPAAQSSGATIAIAVAVIPYVFVRAVEKFARFWREKQEDS